MKSSFSLGIGRVVILYFYFAPLLLFLIFVYILNNVVLSWLYIRNKDTTDRPTSKILNIPDNASALWHNDQKNWKVFAPYGECKYLYSS